MPRALTLSAVLIAIASVSAFGAMPAADGWGPTTNGVRTRLRLDPADIAPGDAVTISLEIQNLGAQNMYSLETEAGCSFRLTVIGPAGTELAPRPQQGVSGRRMTVASVRTLAPGETQTITYELNRLYDVTAPGMYHIVARYGFHPDLYIHEVFSTVTVTSNPAILMVRPPAATTAAEDWGPTNQGVRLRLRLDQPVVKQGQEVMLSIDLQSVGAARMYYYDSDTWSDYPLTVVGPTGETLKPLRDVGIIYGRISCTLEPGETATFGYPLNPMYDITAPGQYHITARGSVWAEGGHPPAELVSNAVILTVQASPDYVPPLTVTEADQPFHSFVTWKGWVHAATAKGVFRACTLDRRWHEIPDLPPGGRFADAPEFGPTLYYAVPARYGLVDGHLTLQSEPALYVATDLGAWALVNRTQHLLRLFVHPNGTLYGVSEEVTARARGFRLVTSSDGGRTWKDITGPAAGTFRRISQDPDHPDLVVVDTVAEHLFVLQAADISYQWQPILIDQWWERHPESREDLRRWAEAAMHPPTMRTYFMGPFGARPSEKPAAAKEGGK